MHKQAREKHKDNTDALLRQGMRALAVPEASAEFDARVHQALAEPMVVWTFSWAWVRPFLVSAALSMAVSIIILAMTQGSASGRVQFPKLSPAASVAKNTEALRFGIAGMGSGDAIEQDNTQ